MASYQGYQRPVRVHGTIRDTFHHHDNVKEHEHFEIRQAKATKHVDLRYNVRRVYDQEQIGSCTANAVCSAYSFFKPKYRGNEWNPSRLFLYYNSRAVEHHPRSDSGVSIRHAINALDNDGLCNERQWPYTQRNLFKKPTEDCYISAEKRSECYAERVLPYHSQRRYESHATDMYKLKACLHQGFPFVFGFDVHENFESGISQSKHSIMPWPEGRKEGSHAVLAVGYNDNYHGQGCVIVLNSWGTDFGDEGYFYMPYDIITDHRICFDYWKVTFP